MPTKAKDDLIEQLKLSKGVVGELVPILTDTDGRVIDGHHREEAGFQRKTSINLTQVAKNIGYDRQVAEPTVMLRINLERRIVSANETKRYVNQLYDGLLANSVPPDKLLSEVCRLSGLSQRQAYRHLSSRQIQYTKLPAGLKPVANEGGIPLEAPTMEDQARKETRLPPQKELCTLLHKKYAEGMELVKDEATVYGLIERALKLLKFREQP